MERKGARRRRGMTDAAGKVGMLKSPRIVLTPVQVTPAIYDVLQHRPKPQTLHGWSRKRKQPACRAKKLGIVLHKASPNGRKVACGAEKPNGVDNAEEVDTAGGLVATKRPSRVRKVRNLSSKRCPKAACRTDSEYRHVEAASGVTATRISAPTGKVVGHTENAAAAVCRSISTATIPTIVPSIHLCSPSSEHPLEVSEGTTSQWYCGYEVALEMLEQQPKAAVANRDKSGHPKACSLAESGAQEQSRRGSKDIDVVHVDDQIRKRRLTKNPTTVALKDKTCEPKSGGGVTTKAESKRSRPTRDMSPDLFSSSEDEPPMTQSHQVGNRMARVERLRKRKRSEGRKIKPTLRRVKNGSPTAGKKALRRELRPASRRRPARYLLDSSSNDNSEHESSSKPSMFGIPHYPTQRPERECFSSNDDLKKSLSSLDRKQEESFEKSVANDSQGDRLHADWESGEKRMEVVEESDEESEEVVCASRRRISKRRKLRGRRTAVARPAPTKERRNKKVPEEIPGEVVSIEATKEEIDARVKSVLASVKKHVCNRRLFSSSSCGDTCSESPKEEARGGKVLPVCEGGRILQQPVTDSDLSTASELVVSLHLSPTSLGELLVSNKIGSSPSEEKYVNHLEPCSNHEGLSARSSHEEQKQFAKKKALDTSQVSAKGERALLPPRAQAKKTGMKVPKRLQKGKRNWTRRQEVKENGFHGGIMKPTVSASREAEGDGERREPAAPKAGDNSPDQQHSEQQAEDSGYPGSVSGSDASSRFRNSNSPVDTQRTSVDGKAESCCTEGVSTQAEQSQLTLPYDRSPAVEPLDQSNLRDSVALGLSMPEAYPVTSTTVLSAATPISVLSHLQRDGDPTLSSAMAVEEVVGMTDREFHAHLDSLLDEDCPAQQLFEPSQMVICKVESLATPEDLGEYDDILDSESVNTCLQTLESDLVNVCQTTTALATLCTVTAQTHMSACSLSSCVLNSLESDFVSEYINAEIVTPAEMSTLHVPIQTSAIMVISEVETGLPYPAADQGTIPTSILSQEPTIEVIPDEPPTPNTVPTQEVPQSTTTDTIEKPEPLIPNPKSVEKDSKPAVKKRRTVVGRRRIQRRITSRSTDSELTNNTEDWEYDAKKSGTSRRTARGGQPSSQGDHQSKGPDTPCDDPKGMDRQCGQSAVKGRLRKQTWKPAPQDEHQSKGPGDIPGDAPKRTDGECMQSVGKRRLRKLRKQTWKLTSQDEQWSNGLSDTPCDAPKGMDEECGQSVGESQLRKLRKLTRKPMSQGEHRNKGVSDNPCDAPKGERGQSAGKGRLRRLRKPTWKLVEGAHIHSDRPGEETGEECQQVKCSAELLQSGEEGEEEDWVMYLAQHRKNRKHNEVMVKRKSPTGLPANERLTTARDTQSPLEIDARCLISGSNELPNQLFQVQAPELSSPNNTTMEEANLVSIAGNPFVQTHGIKGVRRAQTKQSNVSADEPFLATAIPVVSETSSRDDASLKPASAGVLTFSLDKVLKDIHSPCTVSSGPANASARIVEITDIPEANAVHRSYFSQDRERQRPGEDLSEAQVKKARPTLQLPPRLEERLGKAPDESANETPGTDSSPSNRQRSVATKENVDQPNLATFSFVVDHKEVTQTMGKESEMQDSDETCNGDDGPMFNLSYVLQETTKSACPLSRSVRYTSDSSSRESQEECAEKGESSAVCSKQLSHPNTIVLSTEEKAEVDTNDLARSPDFTQLSLVPLVNVEEQANTGSVSPAQQIAGVVTTNGPSNTTKPVACAKQNASMKEPQKALVSSWSWNDGLCSLIDAADTSCDHEAWETPQTGFVQSKGKTPLSWSLKRRLGEKVVTPDVPKGQEDHREPEEDFIDIFLDKRDEDCFTMYSYRNNPKLSSHLPRTPSPTPTPSTDSDAPQSPTPHPSYKKEQVAKWVEQVITNPPPPPPPPPLPYPTFAAHPFRHNSPSRSNPRGSAYPRTTSPMLEPCPQLSPPVEQPSYGRRMWSGPSSLPQCETSSYFHNKLQHSNLPYPPLPTCAPSNRRPTASHGTLSPPLLDGYAPDRGGRRTFKYCNLYLRGYCHFSNCRFAHAPRDTVPENILEEAVFNQPLEKISVDIIGRYITDPHSQSLIKCNKSFPILVDMIRSLMDKHFAVAARCYRILSSLGVKFSHRVLFRLLDLCAQQSPSSSCDVPVPTLAKQLFSVLRTQQGYVVVDNYLPLMRTLANFKMYSKLYDVYQRAKQGGLTPTPEMLQLVLRAAHHLDHRVFHLLNDIKLCSSSVLDEARLVDQLVVSVDYKAMETQSEMFGVWLDRSPAAEKLSYNAFLRLFRVFSSTASWNHLLCLLEQCPNFVGRLGQDLCSCLETISGQADLLERAVALVDRMTEEQLQGVSQEVWNTVILHCARRGYSEYATKVHSIMSKAKKPLAMQAVTEVMEMYLRQKDPSAALAVLQDTLKHDPPSLPPMSVLAPLCQALSHATASQDLFVVIDALLKNKITPSTSILQSLLHLHSKEKVYSKLAQTVKKAKECGVLLDREFYHEALVQLRVWGQDQDALSAVYKAMRKLDQFGESMVEQQSVTNLTTATTPATDEHISSSESCVELSEPPSPPAVAVCGPADVASTPSMSLERALQGSGSQNYSSLLQLLEENGKQGQFGAVAAILVSIQCTSGSYNSVTVRAVWNAITTSKQKPPNALCNLMSHLNQSRLAAIPNQDGRPKEQAGANLGSALTVSDRWLVSQLGIALLKTSAQNEQWQNGFVVLHHLHRFGIHYVAFCEPPSSLPPLLPNPPSPCNVALTAVKVCLMVQQVRGAVEVLKGCKWVQAASADELQERTGLLVSVTEHCLEGGMLEEAWLCLQAVHGSFIPSQLTHVLTNLHNKLLQSVLAVNKTDLAVCVYNAMHSVRLACLPTVFSSLLGALCQRNNHGEAQKLCKAAIAEGFYRPIVTGDVFLVFIPIGVVRVEVQLLLENHLGRIGNEFGGHRKKELKPLIIQFAGGLRPTIEQVLSRDFRPGLRWVPISRESHSMTVPVDSLQLWLAAHCWAGGDSGNPPPQWVVRLKRPLSRPTGTVPETSGCGESSKSRHGVDLSPAKRIKIDTAVIDGRVPCLQEETVAQGGRGRGKEQRKQFREAVCRLFVNQLKPYYQEGRFKSDSDYTHLLQVLSTQVYKQKREQKNSKWQVDESTIDEISRMVMGVMSKCAVYSQETDNELGLASSSD